MTSRGKGQVPARANQWRAEVTALAWLLGGDTVTRLAGQVAIVLTARLLGPSEYGTLAAGVATFSLMMVVADLGVGDSAVQRLTRRPGGEETFWRDVAPVRLAASLPLLPGGLALAVWSSNASIQAAGLLLASAPFATLLMSRVFAARISETFGSAAAWTTLLGLGQSFGALGAAIVFAHTGVSAAAGIALALTVSGLVASRMTHLRLPNAAATRSWLRRGLPFGLTAAAVAIYSRADRIVVAIVEGSAAAGGYVAAYNIIMVSAIAGAALHAVVLPRLLDEHRQGSAPKWRTRAAVIACITTPLAILLFAFSSRIVVTLYGPSYSSSASILRVLSPLAVLYVVNPFLASSLVAAGRQGALAGIALLNALVAAVSYPLLTLRFSAVGTAAASVGAELLSIVLVVAVLRRQAAVATDKVLGGV